MMVILLGKLVYADISNADVEKFINNISTEFNRISKIKNDKQKNKEYNSFAEQIVDSQWIARFIMGNHWKELDSKQQTEFHNLYKEYLILNYMSKLQNYNMGLRIENINKQKSTVYMVKCNTKDENNKNIEVNFRLSVKKDNTLLITDIIPEGISFIGRHRTEIDTAINKLKFDGFMKDLKNKINNLKNGK